MKKILLFLLTILMGLMASCSCAPNNGDGSGNSSTGGNVENNNRKYITHFDGYNQCIIFPAATFQTSLYEGGRVINDWIVDPQYISEGEGSIQVSLMEGYVNWYKGKIQADNFVSSITDINGAKKISLDVYNPSDKDIEVTVGVESISEIMFSVSKICPSKQWTTISTEIEQQTYGIVSWYSIKLENKTDNEVFTVYMDNFYLEF